MKQLEEKLDPDCYRNVLQICTRQVKGIPVKRQCQRTVFLAEQELAAHAIEQIAAIFTVTAAPRIQLHILGLHTNRCPQVECVADREHQINSRINPISIQLGLHLAQPSEGHICTLLTKLAVTDPHT